MAESSKGNVSKTRDRILMEEIVFQYSDWPGGEEPLLEWRDRHITLSHACSLVRSADPLPRVEYMVLKQCGIELPEDVTFRHAAQAIQFGIKAVMVSQ